jgi:sugar phosphate isomerase/epimerase
MYSRRQLGRIAGAALPLRLLRAAPAAKIDSRIHGVQLGVHTFSFSTLPHDGILDAIAGAMADAGIGECILLAQQMEPGELWDQARPAQGVHIDPDAQALARKKLTEWRNSVSLDYFQAIRRKFENAGLAIHGYGASLSAADKEFDRTFEIARALGAEIVTLGGTMDLARRLAPVAGKHKALVGLQGHPGPDSADPSQISRPRDFMDALALSKNFRVCIDIGDATGGGWDALRFVEEHHGRIHAVYLKDRRKDRVTVPWGEGDSPVRPVLQLIRDRKYPIRCYIDCDYPGSGSRAAEVKRCFAYAKAALA